MTTQARIPLKRRSGNILRLVTIAGVVLILLVAMAMNTKVVKIGSDEDVRTDKFSPEAFGASEFPKVQAAIVERAGDAVTLADGLAEDKEATVAKYGVPGSIGPYMSVSFTGVVGEGKSGIYNVAVDGLPEELLIRVQTGPAINGTELRDATGTIKFGQFTNQIEYQNAGAALNKQMKEQVLAPIDTGELSGKTISVVGAFTLINPKSWLVTPVRLEVL